MYNFSFFYCKGNEISSEDGDFLVEASAISGFSCESVSRFWKSECTSDQPFFFCFNGESRDGLGSEFGDGLVYSDIFLPKPPLSPLTKGGCFDDVELFCVDEEVDVFHFFPTGLGL